MICKKNTWFLQTTNKIHNKVVHIVLNINEISMNSFKNIALDQ
jgi:hypothetical protein